MSGQITLSAQAGRYTGGSPDLGYHYDALDATVAQMSVAGGTITVLPGTAIGLGTTTSPGTSPGPSTVLTSGRAPLSPAMALLNPNTFASIRYVQEGPLLDDGGVIWQGLMAAFVPDFIPTDEGYPPPVLDFRFSNFYLPGPDYHIWSGGSEDGGFRMSLDTPRA